MPRDLVAGRDAFVRGIRPEHRGAHRYVTDERGEVAQHRELVEHAEVVGLSTNREPHAVVDRGAWDLLDRAQRVDHVVACGVVGDRRERVPAVSGDHGGDAIRRGRRDVGIPEQVGVEVRVRIDEPGRHHEITTIDLLAPRARDLAHDRDAIAVDCDVGFEPGPPLPSTTSAPRTTRSCCARPVIAPLVWSSATCRGSWRGRRRATSRRPDGSAPGRARCRRTARLRARGTRASARR